MLNNIRFKFLFFGFNLQNQGAKLTFFFVLNYFLNFFFREAGLFA